MIYLKAGTQRVVIVEPGNIRQMTGGEPLKTPEGDLLIAYCPDIEWLAQEMLKLIDAEQTFNPAKLDELLAEGLKRFPVYRTEQQMKKLL